MYHCLYYIVTVILAPVLFECVLKGAEADTVADYCNNQSTDQGSEKWSDCVLSCSVVSNSLQPHGL